MPRFEFDNQKSSTLGKIVGFVDDPKQATENWANRKKATVAHSVVSYAGRMKDRFSF